MIIIELWWCWYTNDDNIQMMMQATDRYLIFLWQRSPLLRSKLRDFSCWRFVGVQHGFQFLWHVYTDQKNWKNADVSCFKLLFAFFFLEYPAKICSASLETWKRKAFDELLSTRIQLSEGIFAGLDVFDWFWGGWPKMQTTQTCNIHMQERSHHLCMRMPP